MTARSRHNGPATDHLLATPDQVELQITLQPMLGK